MIMTSVCELVSLWTAGPRCDLCRLHVGQQCWRSCRIATADPGRLRMNAYSLITLKASLVTNYLEYDEMLTFKIKLLLGPYF
jgi:hypothetical protein